jgi:hypothetical protein
MCQAIYWCSASAMLWWTYDFSAVVKGGFYRRDQALSLVFRMALVLTVLTCAAWVVEIWHSKPTSRWKMALDVGWKTSSVLFVYLLIVVVRRQLWSPSQGFSASAQFLPVVGRVNGAFLAEAGPLSFLIQVIPGMGIISGILFYFQSYLVEAWHRPRTRG